MLELIGDAIDQLAADAAASPEGTPEQAPARLARIWAMIAELDPAMAGRLRGYTGGQAHEDSRAGTEGSGGSPGHGVVGETCGHGDRG
jgi:hypothetical protein